MPQGELKELITGITGFRRFTSRILQDNLIVLFVYFLKSFEVSVEKQSTFDEGPVKY